MNYASAVVDGKMEFFCWIKCGILQGCPASGLLFNVAIDPFLCAFDKDIVQTGQGQVKACADDVGAVLKKLGSLSALKETFDTAQLISGLPLTHQ